MAKSHQTFSKKKKTRRKKLKKRQDKAQKKEERKSTSNKGKSFEDMIAYIDENGNITSTPPDPSKRSVINTEDIQVSVRKQK